MFTMDEVDFVDEVDANVASLLIYGNALSWPRSAIFRKLRLVDLDSELSKSCYEGD